MLIRYEDFELIINETAGHLTVEARGPRQITVEPLPLGPDLASVLHKDEQLAEALKQLQRGYSPSRAQMLAIGRLLFAILMPAQIIRAYDRAKGGLSEGTQLRLRLNVRPPTLSRLPWELLFDSTQNTFLAMRRAQPLVRVLDNPNPVAKLRIDGPLSVLLVQAQPIDLAPLNLEESKKALQEAFGRRAEIKVLPHATPAKLRLALQKKTFHILHYDGHGFFDEHQQSGFLALENNKRRSTALSGQQLANYLSGTQVRLVVLSACQTAQDSMRQRFVGVAQQLMRSSSLPAVVAMQFAIPDTSAVAFTRGFYGALANGFPVEAALASGRMAIQEVAGMRRSDWATPLLMMRTTDGRLWEHFIEDEEVTPILTSRNPYVGLQTFQKEDAAWFFGREGLVDLLEQKAQESPFLAILGPSGSGKSSAVLAGLLPALKAGALFDSDKWLYLSIKPTNRPLDTLAAALNKLQGGDLGTLSTLRQALVSNERALLLAADMVRADKANTRLVLVVDQFEELWTLAPTESDARQTFVIEKQTPFIRLLLSAIEEQTETKDPPLLIILTMRIDFLHRAAEIRDLARHIGEHDVIVSPMQPYELHRAIELPAKKAGGTFEPGLIDELIKQTRDRQGALPLLEYTLQELWHSKLPDGTMTWHAFKTLNGVEGALAIRADSILSEYYNSADKQEQLRHILLRLVQPGEGTADTRRRVLLNELVPAGTDLERVQTLLKPLVDERLLTTTGEQTIGSETIEVSHEALISAWPTFKKWIDHAREDLRLQLQLEEAAKEWESHEENQGYLWSGLRLANAETWLNRAQPSLNERDQRFLQASRAEEKAAMDAQEAARHRELTLERRARRQLQFLVVILSLVVIAGAGVLTYPEWLRWRAIALNEMAEIPGGVATIGTNEQTISSPAFTITLPSFEIGRYEVTNEQYCLCYEASQCDSKPTYSDQDVCDTDEANYPVTNITLRQANDYCKWIGQRLPTEIEWEWVARGIEKRRYPTGNERPTKDQANLNYNNNGTQGKWEVGRAEADYTPDSYHVWDMAGNVQEWTISPYLPYIENTPSDFPSGFFVIRGGSWLEPPEYANAITRDPIEPDESLDWVGFRCLKGLSWLSSVP